MFAFQSNLAGLVAVACLSILLAIARRNERRRRIYLLPRAQFDARDSLARFHRIIGR
jgi:hypothetical protein